MNTVSRFTCSACHLSYPSRLSKIRMPAEIEHVAKARSYPSESLPNNRIHLHGMIRPGLLRCWVLSVELPDAVLVQAFVAEVDWHFERVQYSDAPPFAKPDDPA